MNVNYNKYAKTFAQSRKNMKWAELEYFFSFLDSHTSILDIACGSGRLLEQYKSHFGELPEKYLGIDISEGLICEARKFFSHQDFLVGDMRMISSDVGDEKYDSIFCIAGFHHLENMKDRIKALKEMKKSLKAGAKIFLTNWLLHTGDNFEKYKSSQIRDSKSSFGSFDYSIKIGEYMRFYHSFSLDELKYLAGESGLKIKENRIFDTGKNTITILYI